MDNKYLNIQAEYFESQTNGLISNSITQNWTIQALECYKNCFNCKNCSITKAHYSFKCKMKEVVKILLKTLGKPNEKEILNQVNLIDNNVA